MGTVSLTLPADGDTIDAADVNTPLNALAAVINGGLDNSNITSGANIDASKINIASLSNPYKFSAYRNAAWTQTNATTKIVFDTELYDTNNNFASGTYTVPLTGFYHFDSSANISSNADAQDFSLIVYKNGSQLVPGFQNTTSKGSGTIGANVSIDVSLTAGDTIDIYGFWSGSSVSGGTGVSIYFTGHLISKT